MKPKLKLLYVDDEDINLKLFEIILADEFEVLTAINGQIGLELLDKNPDTHVVISDMKMPRMTGLEFIEQAKAKHTLPKYYILTGYDISADIEKALETKLILKYFRKPFNLNEINQAINEVAK